MKVDESTSENNQKNNKILSKQVVPQKSPIHPPSIPQTPPIHPPSVPQNSPKVDFLKEFRLWGENGGVWGELGGVMGEPWGKVKIKINLVKQELWGETWGKIKMKIILIKQRTKVNYSQMYSQKMILKKLQKNATLVSPQEQTDLMAVV